MNRRNFLRSLVGGVAASAAVRTWPFRVFSFPSEIKPAYFVPESWASREFYSGIQYLMWEEKTGTWVLNPGQKSTLRTTT